MKVAKSIIGVFFTLLIVFGAISAILYMWGIHIIEWKIILKVLISAGIAAVAVFVLWIASVLFFKKGI